MTIKAKKKIVDGVTFDSIFESEVYGSLRRKLYHPGLRVSVHHPIHYTGGRRLSYIQKTPTWKVDFLIVDISSSHAKPLFAVEAKGRFLPSDKFKFVLWDIFQTIPLFVVYQGRLPANLQTSGWVNLMRQSSFDFLDIEKQVNWMNKVNEQRMSKKGE